MIGRFLAGVAVLVYDPGQARYLLLCRSSSKDYAAGEWECVTGRVEQGESYTQAARREVQEEIGCAARPELLLGLTHFYRGPAGPENELLGAIFTGAIPDPQAVRLSKEHAHLRWLTWTEIDALLAQDHWLRPVVQRAEWLRATLPAAAQEQLTQESWEF